MDGSLRVAGSDPSHGSVADDHKTIRMGTSVVRHEAQALAAMANLIDRSFCTAVQHLRQCRGSVIVCGMGKAGLIGQKIAATLSSTGTRAHFLHPAEAIHGDLGRVSGDDVTLLLSHSGETQEVLQLLPSLLAWNIPRIAITGRPSSRLAKQSTVTLWIGQLQEAGSLGLAPTASTTAMLAMGDALALAASDQQGFTRDDFARYHPGGALGRRLAKVEDGMRSIDRCRVAAPNQTVRQVLISAGRPGRRDGAVLLVDDQRRLAGIFTDSDLAKLLETQQDRVLDWPVGDVMTRSPTTVRAGTMMEVAIGVLRENRISELPVVDAGHRPVGIIDITDVLAGDSSSDATPPESIGRAKASPRYDAQHVDRSPEFSQNRLRIVSGTDPICEDPVDET